MSWKGPHRSTAPRFLLFFQHQVFRRWAPGLLTQLSNLAANLWLSCLFKCICHKKYIFLLWLSEFLVHKIATNFSQFSTTLLRCNTSDIFNATVLSLFRNAGSVPFDWLHDPLIGNGPQLKKIPDNFTIWYISLFFKRGTGLTHFNSCSHLLNQLVWSLLSSNWKHVWFFYPYFNFIIAVTW